jgi:peptidoglycan/xylan/chitin deacetylase (PgdA/CDA1 family)
MKIISDYVSIASIILIGLLSLGPLLSSITSGVILTSNNLKTNGNINKYNYSRVTVLAFDDAWKSQFIYAKPILDRFGFKASFFIVCNYIGKNPDRLTWTDVQALESQGHDIESHTMNHIPVNDLSQQQLDYEIGQSKQCIIDHSIVTNNSENGNNNNVQIFIYLLPRHMISSRK